MVLPINLIPKEIGNFPVAYVGENEVILVESDAFIDSVLVDMRNVNDLLLHIYNSHATKPLDYSIYGHAKEVDTAPAFGTEWNEIKASTTLTAVTSTAESLTDHWAFVLIRIKRSAPGVPENSTAKIWVRAKK